MIGSATSPRSQSVKFRDSCSTRAKVLAQTSVFSEEFMLISGIIFKRNAMIASAVVAFALTTYHSSAQTVYDAAARTSLANDINQTYGTLVTPSLSIAELFD